ncbi:hypothetical protein AMECASPLE_016715 [Ameca splendens]|uniref:Uncharacterized protein n=1 Tax=Ameca splendens TaxID=208324 RepID=A0ABV1A8N9_9TELE
MTLTWNIYVYQNTFLTSLSRLVFSSTVQLCGKTVICLMQLQINKKSSTCAVVSFWRECFASCNSFSSFPQQTMTLQGALDPKTKHPEAQGSNNCNNHPTEVSIF